MTARRIVQVQAAIAFICSVVFFLVSRSAGTSAVLASGCVLLPTMYYAWIQARTLNATRILLHGVLKMMLTLVMVAVCIVTVGIEPMGFFVTFAALQLGYFAGKQDAGQGQLSELRRNYNG
ncbi:MAG: ATP synthase subunit I [Pseudomonadales bacterium]